MIIWTKAFKCEICSHRWLITAKSCDSGTIPSQCGRCKSRHWHKSGIDSTKEAGEPLSGLFPEGLLSSDIAIAAILKPVETNEEEITDFFEERRRVVYDEDLPTED